MKSLSSNAVRPMAFPNKTTEEQRQQEERLYQSLRNWYTTPRLQAELRTKENEAIRAVLYVLDQRRRKKT
jgi:hypothetical protein